MSISILNNRTSHLAVSTYISILWIPKIMLEIMNKQAHKCAYISEFIARHCFECIFNEIIFAPLSKLINFYSLCGELSLFHLNYAIIYRVIESLKNEIPPNITRCNILDKHLKIFWLIHITKIWLELNLRKPASKFIYSVC